MNNTGSFQLPTSEERKIYSKIFKSLDPQKLGLITGEVAGLTFEKSGLPSETLYQIWEIADDQGNGFLAQKDFIRALRLIGHVQSGKKLDPSLANIPAPLPKFEGMNYGTMSPSSTGMQPQQSTGGSRMSSAPAVPPQLPAVIPTDITKFIQLFNRHVPASYPSISGSEAREVFLKAKLPEQLLGLIWNISDRGAKGNLTKDEFCLAMYLIQGTLRGSIKQLPSYIPENIWSQISQILVSINYGNDPQTFNSIPEQSTGNLLNLEPSNTGRTKPLIQTIPEAKPIQISQSPQVSHSSAVMVNQIGNSEWTIPTTQRQQFDQLFDSLDKSGKGTLGPNEVAGFLMNSKLGQDDLAKIWDLADVDNTGLFSKAEFAISMFLVQKRLKGEPLPDTLPIQLINNARGQKVKASIPAEPAPVRNVAPPPPQPRQSSLNDLVDIFGSSPSQSPAPTQQPTLQRTGSVQVHSTGGSLGSRKFKPTSSFGQQIVHDQEVKEQNKTSLLQLDEATKEDEDSGDEDDGFGYSYKPPTASKSVPPPVPTSNKPTYDALKTISTGNHGNFPPPPPAARGLSSSGPASSSSKELDDVNNAIMGEHVETSNIKAQISSVESQSKELSTKISQAKTQLSAVREAKATFVTRLQQAKALLEEESQQYEAIKKSVIESQQENESLRQKSSILEAEYNNHQAEYQNYQGQLTEKQNENAVFREKLGTLTAENNDLVKRLESIQKALKDQVAFNNIQERQIEVLNTKNISLQGEIKAAENELNLAEDTGNKKVEKIRELENKAKSSVAAAPPPPISRSITKSSGNSSSVPVMAAASAAVATVVGGSAIIANKEDSFSFTATKERGFNPFSTGKVVPTHDTSAEDFFANSSLENVGKPEGTVKDEEDHGSPVTPAASGGESIKLGEDAVEYDELDNFTEFPSQEDFESQFDDKSTTEKGSHTVMTKETSDTTPPSSDFQFGGNNPGLQLPPYNNTVRRPESLTSSVQNNPAMSVRDDSVPESEHLTDDENTTLAYPPIPETYQPAESFQPLHAATMDDFSGSSSSDEDDDERNIRNFNSETLNTAKTLTESKETVSTSFTPAVAAVAGGAAVVSGVAAKNAFSTDISTVDPNSWFNNVSMGTSNYPTLDNATLNSNNDYQSHRTNSISTTTSEEFMDAKEDLASPTITTNAGGNKFINAGNKSKFDDMFDSSFDNLSPTVEQTNPIDQNIITDNYLHHTKSSSTLSVGNKVGNTPRAFNNDGFSGMVLAAPETGNTAAITSSENDDFDDAFTGLAPVKAEENKNDEFDSAFDDLTPAKKDADDFDDAFNDLTPAKKVDDDFDTAFDDFSPSTENKPLPKKQFDFDDEFENLAPAQEKPIEFLDDDDDDFSRDISDNFDDGFTDFDQKFPNSPLNSQHKNDNDEFDSAFKF